MDEDDGAYVGRRRHDWQELVVVVLLSITTVLTAWSGFQSSKWSGAMSIAFSQASSARIQASRFDGDANRAATIQVALFTQWLQARAANDVALQDYLATRFPEPLKRAFTAWIATEPGTNSHAPASPFAMAQYRLPELAASKAADARADSRFSAALEYNQRGDNYTVLTVAFASVLFFGAMSGRMRGRHAKWFLLSVGIAIFLTAVGLLVAFPKLV